MLLLDLEGSIVFDVHCTFLIPHSAGWNWEFAKKECNSFPIVVVLEDGEDGEDRLIPRGYGCSHTLQALHGRPFSSFLIIVILRPKTPARCAWPNGVASLVVKNRPLSY